MKRGVKVVFLSLLIFCFLTVTAFADMGSKPRAEIKVINPPESEYYIDLLYQPSRPDSVHSNLESSEAYNEAMISALVNYEEDGWYTAYCRGTNAPMWGNLKPDDENTSVFSYVAVPDRFRVIIVTESGEIRVSDIVERKAMEISLTLNYEDMSFTAKPLWQVYAGQFALTCSVTLLAELILLILFRFSIRDNITVFIAANIFTQLVFTAAYSSSFIYGGTIGALMAFIPLEAGVTAAEALIYRKYLKGGSKAKSTLYAITANLTTAALTWINMDGLTDFLFRLLRL